MDTIGRGIVAGFIATLALSLLYEPIELLADTAGTASPAIGLLFHFFVGTLIWGSLFGLLHDHLWGPSWARGIEFAVAAAAFVLLAVIPAIGPAQFGMMLGFTAPIAIVLFHVVYGALLGGIYDHLDPAYDDHHDISKHHHPATR